MVWCWVQKWNSHGPGAALIQPVPAFSSCPLFACPLSGKSYPLTLPSKARSSCWDHVELDRVGTCFPGIPKVPAWSPSQTSPRGHIPRPDILTIWDTTAPQHIWAQPGAGVWRAEQTLSPATPASLALSPCSHSHRSYTVLSWPPLASIVHLGCDMSTDGLALKVPGPQDLWEDSWGHPVWGCVCGEGLALGLREGSLCTQIP